MGGIVSPLFSNLYLHEVLDLWFEREVKPRLRGRAFEIRFADDAVLAFEREEDARRVLAQVAQSPFVAGRHGLGGVRPVVSALSAPPTACASPCFSLRSDSVA